MKNMKSPQFQEKMKQGPVALITVLPNGPLSMGKPLAQWFVYLLIVCIFVALIAGHLLPAGTMYLRVFKVARHRLLHGLCPGAAANSIWYRRSWGVTLKGCFDGLIYARSPPAPSAGCGRTEQMRSAELQ